MLGHAETWLYGGLAGIRIDMTRPPAERIRIAPQIVDGIEAASARYGSVLGEVAVAWRKERGRVHIEVAIPPGAAATLEISACAPDVVLESDRPLPRARGVRNVRHAGSVVIVDIGSGRYELSAPES